MRPEKRLELVVGSVRIACVGALHRQAVASERVIRLCGDEFFEHLAACFLLWLGHGLEPRIIVALGSNAKSPANSVNFWRPLWNGTSAGLRSMLPSTPWPSRHFE